MKTKLSLLALVLAFAAFTGTASAFDRGGHVSHVVHARGFVGHGGHWYGGRWVGGCYGGPVLGAYAPVVVQPPVVETYAAPVVVAPEVVLGNFGVGGCYANGGWYGGYGRDHVFGHFHGHRR